VAVMPMVPAVPTISIAVVPATISAI
jgi:hypothetical protein